jgi:ATP-dependent Lhr-like helicase
MIDVARVGQMLTRIRGQILHSPLTQVSPFAVPLMLEIGRERVGGEAAEMMLAEAADELIAEAMT